MKFHNLYSYSSANAVTIIINEIIRGRCAECMVKIRNAKTILVEIRKWKRPLGSPTGG